MVGGEGKIKYFAGRNEDEIFMQTNFITREKGMTRWEKSS